MSNAEHKEAWIDPDDPEDNSNRENNSGGRPKRVKWRGRRGAAKKNNKKAKGSTTQESTVGGGDGTDDAARPDGESNIREETNDPEPEECEGSKPELLLKYPGSARRPGHRADGFFIRFPVSLLHA